ncbi:MAG: malonyl-ACP O-methyltransferase BioC [Gammaproteobacteria bacterium]
MNVADAIPRAHIARSFGQAASQYDAFANLQRGVADQLLAMLGDCAPSIAVDLGCGTGYCSAQLARRLPNAQLIALDLAIPMLHAAAARLPPFAPLLCADMNALPLHAGSIDLAVSSLALQWCIEPQRVFAELHRVLRPGGRALLSTFGPATLNELRAAWRNVDAHVHVNRFPDQVQLRQAGAACMLSVEVARDVQVRHYPSLLALARELKGIGAHNMNHAAPRGLTSRAAFARAEREFSKGFTGQGVPVTWELYYLDLRKAR